MLWMTTTSATLSGLEVGKTSTCSLKATTTLVPCTHFVFPVYPFLCFTVHSSMVFLAAPVSFYLSFVFFFTTISTLKRTKRSELPPGSMAWRILDLEGTAGRSMDIFTVVFFTCPIFFTSSDKMVILAWFGRRIEGCGVYSCYDFLFSQPISTSAGCRMKKKKQEKSESSLEGTKKRKEKVFWRNISGMTLMMYKLKARASAFFRWSCVCGLAVCRTFSS